MCLGVPMRIIERIGHTARCEAMGIEREVNLFLLQHEEVGPGDLVMVHVGYAIQKMSEEAARTAWDLYEQALSGEVTAADHA